MFLDFFFEQVSSGRLAPGEVPDRAMLWKMARKPKDPKIEIDEGLHLINEKIVRFSMLFFYYFISKSTPNYF